KKREVSQYLRSVLALLAGLLSAYITLSPTFALPLPFSFSYIETPYLFIFSLIAVLIFCMLISLELIAAGFFRLFTGHPTQYSLVSLSTLASLIHAFTIIVFPKWGGYIPFSSLSCILIFFMLFSSAQKKGALRRSIKAQTLSSEPISVKTEKRNAKKICAYREYGKNSDLFTNALKATDPVERFSALYAPCAIVASVVFAAVATAGQGRPELFFWAFSGIITVATPWGLFIAYSAPAKTISKKLLTFGAGISGWDFVRDISQCRYTVLTDSDIYPPQNIRITGVKVFEPYNTEKVLYYAGSVIAESETGLKKVFLDLMREQYIKQGNVSELKFFDSGGISADVNGDHILIGSPMFLLRMGVRIGEGVRIKNGVFVAVNVSLAGIFAMKYEASETVQSAFRLLRRFKVSPIAAVRDFNLTPGLLENKFKLKSQWFEYPEINDRLLLSEPLIGDGSNAAAVMTRDGIVPLSECLAAGKKFYRAVRSNIVVGALSGVIGMLLMFFLAFRAAVTAATPYNTGIYLFLWLIPIMLTSFGSSRY
ncbi:MAG: hypothetical protein Q8878_07655, partial [Bacillota bacterium]|nr:hypothetical protein [Bacillota bacterium]